MVHLVKLALCAVWLALAVVVLAAIWVQLTFSSHPETVLGVMPSNASALRRLSETLSESGGKKLAALERIGLARRLLEASPLDDAPLVLAAQSGAPVDAAAAYRETLRRNPRNISARVQAAQSAADVRDYGGAFFQLARLYAIAPDKEEWLSRAGMSLARADGGADALKPYLLAGEHWAGDLLRHLNNSDFDVNRLLTLNEVFPPGAADYVRRVLAERGVESALLAWVGMLSKADMENFTWPYDAKFVHKTAPLPFNWEVDQLRSEYLKEGGLFATYDGRATPRIAAQVIVLQPGLYVFSATMHGETSPSGGSFKWVIECYPDGAALAEVRTAKLTEKSQYFDFDFEVPPKGCEGQRIVLYGAPGEFPMRARSVTTETSIKARGISKP